MESVEGLSAPATWLASHAIALASSMAVLVAGWLGSRLAGNAIARLLPRARGIDQNFAPLLAQAVKYAILLFALVTALSFIGVPNASIIAVLGAAGLAIALALQGTLSNIAAGIMLVWQRPIAIGEYIVGGGVEGVVVEIGLFGTQLRSSSGLFVYTPNNNLWNSSITNHSRNPVRRIDISFQVPDSTNIGRARSALLAAAAADGRILAEPATTVHIESTAGATIGLRLRAWVSTPDYPDTLVALGEAAKLALKRGLEPTAGPVEATVGADPHAAKNEVAAASEATPVATAAKAP